MSKMDILKKKLSDSKDFIKIYDAYFLVVFIFLIPYALFTIWLMQTSLKDIANNLFAGAIDVIITVIFLMIFIDIREQRRWNSVKDSVYESLVDEITGTLKDISNFCKNIDIGNNRIIFYATEDTNLLVGGYGDLFLIRKNYLNEIELKYFKFLAPSIINSLIKIQKHLKSLDLEIKIRNRTLGSPYRKTDEEILETIKKLMLDIFREADSLRSEPNLKSYNAQFLCDLFRVLKSS